MVFDQRYRVLRKLEAGGMGTVYEAEQIRLGKRVAIKVLRPEVTHNETAVRRFEREARLASRIRHRNVVELLDFGVEQDTAYYVMELLDGRNLATALRTEGRIPWSRARSILLQIARALQAAHREGVIHRDVKPGNCFLLPAEDEDEGELVKVLDFGIAKLEDAFDSDGQLTKTTELLGTAAYMSPEQAQGQPVGARSDVYSLGILAYQILTGRLPFHDESSFNVLRMHVSEPPRPPRSVAPAIPERVEAAVLRALAKEPDDRFESMEAFKVALAQVPASTVGSSTALFEAPEPETGSMTIPRELMGLGKKKVAAEMDGVPSTAVLDDSETHLLDVEVEPSPAPEDATVVLAPPASEHTEIAPSPVPSGEIGPPSGPLSPTPPAAEDIGPPSGPISSTPAAREIGPPSGPLSPVPPAGDIGPPSGPMHAPPGGVMGPASGPAPTLSGPQALRGSTVPYQAMARPAPTSRDDRQLVRLALIGGVIALVLGAAIAVWLTLPDAEGDPSPDPAPNTPAASVTPPPGEPVPGEVALVEPQPAVAPVSSGSSSGSDADADAQAETGAQPDAVTEVEPEPEATPEPTPSGRSGKRRKETDGSVKSKLRRKAKKRCAGVGVPGTSVRVSLSIDPSGALTLARTDAPHQSSALGKCVRAAMDGARFPATGDRRVLALSVDI